MQKQLSLLGDVALSAAAMYIAIVVLIRLSGKRTTSQMNNFDWVVTVSIGSLMSSGALMRDVSVLQAVTAISVLLGLQWLVTKVSTILPGFSDLIRADPAILVQDGRLCPATMRAERVTESEVQSAIRRAGCHKLDEVKWVILESDAAMSVIRRDEVGPAVPPPAEADPCR
ncbi:DUF421 domain-containing protein [Paracoccus sp. MBLB3053]|uniref:DUF421 domain-containing protein n=1 Tax=Paracoccus aurantius TaxID=3073814 RepID=A0ABU2HUK6_9RHOB|nr:YetF domain-containing protein [Paracoccus sp. MBLB3053]MDS9468738.1 DUF421 domain-containing protein [Paracoccus sp. MBLB3053]